MGNKDIELARALRLLVVQQQYNLGNLTALQAIELLSGELTPGDPTTIYNDIDQLQIKAVDAERIAGGE